MRTRRLLIAAPLAVIAVGSFLTGDAGAHSSILRGLPCSLAPVPAAGEPAPLGAGPCPGVRPGGRVLSEVGDCTLNFLFRGPDGTRYIGTAGHCVAAGDEYTFDKHGNARFERIWALGTGPVAMDPAGRRFGEFAYVIKHDPKDFALIRLDPEVPASPEMCHFGAPHGFYSSDTARALSLRYYGNGQGISDVTPARSAVALGTPDPDHLYAAGLSAPGDSGAGVMTADGLAVGVLVTTGYQVRDASLPVSTEGLDVGTMGITRLGPQLARASEKLGMALKLVTAGLAGAAASRPRPIPPGWRPFGICGTEPVPRRPFALARMSLNHPGTICFKVDTPYARRGESSPLLFKTPMSAA